MKEHRKKIFSLISKGEKNELIIDQDSIKNLALNFDQILRENEIKELLEAADFDRDGKINEDDFMKMLKNTNFC